MVKEIDAKFLSTQKFRKKENGTIDLGTYKNTEELLKNSDAITNAVGDIIGDIEDKEGIERNTPADVLICKCKICFNEFPYPRTIWMKKRGFKATICPNCSEKESR